MTQVISCPICLEHEFNRRPIHAYCIFYIPREYVPKQILLDVMFTREENDMLTSSVTRVSTGSWRSQWVTQFETWDNTTLLSNSTYLPAASLFRSHRFSVDLHTGLWQTVQQVCGTESADHLCHQLCLEPPLTTAHGHSSRHNTVRGLLVLRRHDRQQRKETGAWIEENEQQP